MRTHGLVLLMMLAACNPDRDRDGTVRIPKPKDAGTDGGTNLPPGCELNPNNCVANQLVAGDCTCLEACASGYIWDGTECDLLTGPDSGTDDTGTGDTGNPQDTGTPDGGSPDTGTPDTGTPDTGVPACSVNGDCPGTDPACINSQTLDFCNGAAGCQCAQSCDPYSSTNTCGGAVCTWLGPPDPTYPLGLCLNDQGGGTQGQSCNRQYDAQGNVTSDSCNRTRNSICWGASPQSPTGVCTTICGLVNPSVCTAFGNYACDDLGDATGGYGVCLDPRPAYNDLGNSCTAPNECQGNLCSQTLAGSCSSMCAGLTPCPDGSYCLDLPAEGSACAQGCTHNGTTGDDAFCQGRNPMTVCENLGATTPIGICIPACVDNTQCTAPATCVNGHCQ